MTSQVVHPEPVRQRLSRVQRVALMIGGAGLLLAVVGALLNSSQLFRSYLFAYLFWLGITLGCLAWLLMQHIAGGRWGRLIQPLLESSALLVGLMAILFVPLLLGLDSLYTWTQPDVVGQDEMLMHKQPYLNVPFFIGRAALYFVIWGGCILLVARWTRVQEPARRAIIADRLRRFSGPALALYGLCITFAAFDWIMSLEPHWYSTIFGVLIAAGQVVTGLSFAIVVLVYLAQMEPLAQVVSHSLLLDLGNLLLAAVLFWAYIAFMQFLIIWSADIPEEVVWYLHRLEGGWEWVAIALVIFHFAVPFALLLSGRIKRNPRRLATVAMLLLAAQLLHLYWMVTPVFAGGRFRLHWLDLALLLLIGGVWVAAFVWILGRRPLVQPADLEAQEVTVHG